VFFVGVSKEQYPKTDICVRKKQSHERLRKKIHQLKGYEICHNYIREHEGLKGKTPAEACGITVEGKKKGYTLIQNAEVERRKQQSSFVRSLCSHFQTAHYLWFHIGKCLCV